MGKSSFSAERFGTRYPRRIDKDCYLHDVLGSVIGVTDEQGNQKEAYSFDVWGNRYDRQNRNNSNHTDNGWNALPATLFGFNGKRFDPKAGLYDYGFRDYKPEVARWTTVDPIHAGKNWYGYVENDPVNWVDRFGLLPEVPGNGTVPEMNPEAAVPPPDAPTPTNSNIADGATAMSNGLSDLSSYIEEHTPSTNAAEAAEVVDNLSDAIEVADALANFADEHDMNVGGGSLSYTFDPDDNPNVSVGVGIETDGTSITGVSVTVEIGFTF